MVLGILLSWLTVLIFITSAVRGRSEYYCKDCFQRLSVWCTHSVFFPVLCFQLLSVIGGKKQLVSVNKKQSNWLKKELKLTLCKENLNLQYDWKLSFDHVRQNFWLTVEISNSRYWTSADISASSQCFFFYCRWFIYLLHHNFVNASAKN